jgi:cytoskeletal protein CcmA (bactofilin family)
MGLLRPVTAVARTLHIALVLLCLNPLIPIAPPGTAGEDERAEAIEAALPAKDTENVYAAGFSIRPVTPVAGDWFAAGGFISIDQPIDKDAVIAGGDIQVKGPIGEDLRAAGGQITVHGNIGGDAIIAGGKVTFTPESQVAGSAWLAGGEVSVAGSVAKALKIYAGRIAIRGEVNGHTHLTAQQIEILPGARINGALTYASRHAIKIDPKAVIIGKVTREPMPPAWREGEAWEVWIHGPEMLGLLGLIATGVIFTLLFPGFTHAAEAKLKLVPWKSIGLGIAVIFAGPAVIVIFLITVLGIPIALALLASYPLLLLFGYLTAAGFIGDRGVRLWRKDAEITQAWRVAGLIGALVLLALICMIPVVGGLIVLIVLLSGVGALVLQIFEGYARTT